MHIIRQNKILITQTQKATEDWICSSWASYVLSMCKILSSFPVTHTQAQVLTCCCAGDQIQGLKLLGKCSTTKQLLPPTGSCMFILYPVILLVSFLCSKGSQMVPQQL